MQRKNIALGPRFGLLLVPQERLLWLQEVAIWEIFEFLGGLVIYSSYQVDVLTWVKSYLYLCIYPKKGFSSGGTVWSGTYRARPSITVPEGRSGRFLRFFGGLVIYNAYQVEAFTWVKSYLYLWAHPKKGFSTGGTVWSGTWPSRASVMAPGAKLLEDFWDSGRGWWHIVLTKWR